jgi:soluble lytic murein transglycosylase-like protein
MESLGKGNPKAMKIDFAARYKEVANLLQASTKPSNAPLDEAFEKDLGSLLLQPSENTEVKPQRTEPYLPKQTLREPMGDMRASLRLDAPALEMPPMTPLSPPVGVPEEVPAVPAVVKTPTVLEVKRVEIPASGSGDPAPLERSQIIERLISASKVAGINPALAQAVVNSESSFNIKAVSNDGHASKGLFQLLDTTGRHLMSKADLNDEEYDPFNPDLNIKLGTSYLKYLHDIFRVPTELPNRLQTRAAADDQSLEKLAVAAFNAGEGRVASAQTRTAKVGNDPAHYEQVAPFLPSSTREYVSRVLASKKLF